MYTEIIQKNANLGLKLSSISWFLLFISNQTFQRINSPKVFEEKLQEGINKEGGNQQCLPAKYPFFFFSHYCLWLTSR